VAAATAAVWEQEEEGLCTSLESLPRLDVHEVPYFIVANRIIDGGRSLVGFSEPYFSSED
jgi:hypothetical protein